MDFIIEIHICQGYITAIVLQKQNRGKGWKDSQPKESYEAGGEVPGIQYHGAEREAGCN